MIYILLVSWVATTCVVGDDQLSPIKAEDLQSIVNWVTKDVDRHLKMAYTDRGEEHDSLPDLPEFSSVTDTGNRKEYENFMKIDDSMHYHWIKNLGQPSDESTNMVLNTESFLEQLSKYPNKDRSKESSQAYKIRVGSTKGVPGVNFPDYTDIPITSFTCSEKPYFPGFYADLDTGCQVFHVCWPDRRESFLCPMGTTFNQALSVCDYWYNSNCSLAPYYYTVNAEVESLSKIENKSVSTINTLLENTDSDPTQKPDSSTYGHTAYDSVMPFISQVIPMKVKIVVYPKTATQRLKIVTSASIGEDKKADIKQKSRKKNLYISKHSRKPRSLEYTKSRKDDMLPLGRTAFHVFKALDRAVVDIENSNETFSKFSGYAKRAVKSVKSFLSYYVDEPVEHFSSSYEPGSELYEQDMEMQEIQEDREFWKNSVLLISVLMEKYHERELLFQQKNSKDTHELETLNPEPLTNLNPRFIIKPAVGQTFGQQSRELPQLKKEKCSATISNPVTSPEDRLNINPHTKKMLLKNYMKLFKTKHRYS